MEVILVEDVANLGHIGELVSVRPGYGRNFLLPRNLAVPASTKNKRQLEHEKKIAGFRIAKAKAEAEVVAKQLGAVAVTLKRKVGEQDKMFGSVTSQDIADALQAKGVKVDRKKVHLAEPIKGLGEFKVQVRLRADVSADIKVSVVAE